MIALFSEDSVCWSHPFSSYACCMGNPIKFVDPDGEDIWELDSYGHIVDHKEDDQIAFFYGTWQRTGVGLEFDPGSEIFSKTYTYSPDEIKVSSLYNVKTRQKIPYGFQNR